MVNFRKNTETLYLERIMPGRQREGISILSSPRFLRSFWVNKEMISQLGLKPERVASRKAMGAIIGMIIGIFIASSVASAAPGFVLLPIIGIFAFLGYSAYDFYILDRLRFEKFMLNAETPIFLDLLASQLETETTGYVYESIKVVAESFSSILNTRLQRLLSQMPALDSHALLERVDREMESPALTELTRIVIQSEKYGMNAAPAVAALAERTYSARLSKGKDIGQKSAASLLLPLIIFFLPVTIAVTLAPAILGFLAK